MKIKTFFAIVCSALVVVASGCISTPDGHSTPGVPFQKDTITSRYDRSVEQLNSATRVVLARNGKMLVDNAVDHSFKAKVNERTVWVKVSKVDDKLTEVIVKVRGSMGADIELAAEISKQIALQLTVSP